MKIRSSLTTAATLVCALFLLTACNARSPLTEEPAAPLATSTVPAIPTAAPASPDGDERVPLDPCTLLNVEEVAPVLGGPVTAQQAAGTGGCSYSLSGSPNSLPQLVVTAAQGDEAKALTLLSAGFIAGFSGDPDMAAAFEGLQNELPDLSLLELVSRLGEILQGAGVTAASVEQPQGGGLWLLFESEAYSQGTLILVRGEEYVSLSQIGGDMDAALDTLTALGDSAFHRLPASFYLMDEAGDGSFTLEAGGDSSTGSDAEQYMQEATPEPAGGLVWVSAPNAGQVYAIDTSTNELAATIDIGRFPRDIAVADGRVWVVSETEGLVWRIDPTTLSVVETIHLNGNTLHIDADASRLWVVGGLGLRVVDLASGTRYDAITNRCYDVTIGEHYVWVSQLQDNQLLQVDPATRRVVATVPLDGQPGAVLYAHGYVWTVLADSNELLMIDESSGEIAHSKSIRYAVNGMAAGPERFWYTEHATLYSIEPGAWDSRALPAGGVPSGLAYFAGSLWTTSSAEGVVRRLDAHSGELQAEILIGTDVVGIAGGE